MELHSDVGDDAEAMEVPLRRKNNTTRPDAHGNRSTWSSPPKFSLRGNAYNICMDLLTLLLTFAEIGLVLYLSVSHFLHAEEAVEGLAMFLPIALNFIGVMYFLSNPDEREQFESIGCTKCCTDVLQFPIFGPVFTAFMILLISLGWSHNLENYARLEASAAKMRQATTFFSAAPEALVQLTVLLISKLEPMRVDNYFEIAIVVVVLVAIAEANTFSLTSPYFRLFHAYAEDDWHLAHGMALWRKALLFAHACTSIGSRLVASAFLKGGLYYYTHVQFSIALVACLLLEFAYRTALFYVTRLVTRLFRGREVRSGCYEAMHYAWRETILGFGFQSSNLLVQLWFYLENGVFFLFWLYALRAAGGQPPGEEPEVVVAPFAAAAGSGLPPNTQPFRPAWTREVIVLPSSVVFLAVTGLSLLLLLALHCTRVFRLRGPCSGAVTKPEGGQRKHAPASVEHRRQFAGIEQ